MNKPLATALLATVLASFLSCDSKPSSAAEQVTTNVNINLSTLIDSIGTLPDSIVAGIQIDGGEARKVVLEPSRISEDSLAQIPVSVVEGARVEVRYEVWKHGAVVGASTLTWVSGGPLTVRRPDLAPSVRFQWGNGGELVVRRARVVNVGLDSRDPERLLSSLRLDRDGDGRADDSIVPPTGRDSFTLSWDTAGTYRLVATVRDRFGLESRDSLPIRVLAAASVRLSSDTVISIRDTFSLRVGLDLDAGVDREGIRLIWTGTGSTPETTSVVEVRKFAWQDQGVRRIRVQAIDDAGTASTDSVAIEVLRDAPRLDLSRIPLQSDLGAIALLPVAVEQRFGSIVRWGIDFDGDTTSGWDSVVSGPVAAVRHLFGRSGTFEIRVFAEDDDGNRVQASKELVVPPSNAGQVLRRLTAADTTVSVFDTTEIRFARNFPAGSEAEARLEWRIDDGPIQSGPIVVGMKLAWPGSGDRQVAWRVNAPVGATLWDTVRVLVERDAPILDRESLPTEAFVNTPASFAPKGTQKYGRIVRWGLDFDRDTSGGWDVLVASGSAPAVRLFDEEGERTILVRLEDDDGNRVVETAILNVRSGGADLLRRTSPDLSEVSIGDTVNLAFVVTAPAGSASAYRIAWRRDDSLSDTTALVAKRSFLWKTPGEHLVRFRAFGPGGNASWDSVKVRVLQGTPIIGSIRIQGNGVGAAIGFSAVVDPVYGRIERSRWDFGDDGKWDDSTTSPEVQVQKTFTTSQRVSIRFQATDDDGNHVDTVFAFVPSNAAPRFGLVSFAEATVGVTIPVALRATFTDPDGAFDLSTFAIDWDADSTWDTIRSVEGLASEELRHSWSTPGRRVVRVRLRDRSGAEATGSAEVLVKANAPKILSLREQSARTEARVGDTLWFVASILDSSAPADLQSITWRRAGRGDSVLSLRGLSSTDARFPVMSSTAGTYAITAIVRDAVGNLDSATASWQVLRAPPTITGRLRDSVLVARDTATLWMDSLSQGRMGGSVKAVHWSFGGSDVWTLFPSTTQGSSVVLTLPDQVGESFHLIVRATQDNGETSFDTVSASLMESFVDKRDGKVYPQVTIGTTTWMASNLSWKPSITDPVTSTCANEDRCDINGRLYMVPLPLKEQPSSLKVPILVSVCPDGWRLPSDLEFNELLTEGERLFPGLGAGRLLRARTGWGVPLEGQTDPLRFGALPAMALERQSAAWWAFSQQTIPDPRSPDPYPNMMNQSVRTLDDDGLGFQNKYWSPVGASVRCVRLKEIEIDSSWRINPRWFDSLSMPKLGFRGLVPQVSVPVRIRATLQGESVDTTFLPSRHQFEWIDLARFSYHGPGRHAIELEVTQGDVVFRETYEVEISLVEP